MCTSHRRIEKKTNSNNNKNKDYLGLGLAIFMQFLLNFRDDIPLKMTFLKIVQ